MPGIVYAGTLGGKFTSVQYVDYLAADSMNGTGTPPACSMLAGDVLALTTKTTLTSSNNTVCRMLLAADKTANYQVSSVDAGAVGIAVFDMNTNASGVAGSPPALGGVANGSAINYPMSDPTLRGNDMATSRNYVHVATADSANIFRGRIDMNSTDWPSGLTLQHQFDGITAGFILTTTSGVTNYTIQPTTGLGGISTNGATVAQSIIRILGPWQDDPLYNTLVASGAALGPYVQFQFLGAYNQSANGIVYTAQ